MRTPTRAEVKSRLSVMLYVLLFLSLWPQTGLTYTCGQGPGTTDNIEVIFKGRCTEYVEKINPKPFCNKTDHKDCDDLWMDFLDAFKNSTSCNMTSEMYSEFISAATHSIPRGKSMFWQGVNGFVQELSYYGKRFFALEDTLYGYTLNKLSWCWSEETHDFNYTLCPKFDVCPRGPLSAYWEAASREFARVASGTVQVMINGSRSPPYNPSGFFGRVELPSMNVSKVNKIVILLVHGLDLQVVETCNGKSITQLKQQVQARGLEVECVDDPRWIRFYMCVDNPTSPLCSSAPSLRLSFILILNVLFVITKYIL